MKRKGRKGKVKVVRACTVPQSLGFVSGMLPDLCRRYEVTLLSSPGPDWAAVEKTGERFGRVEVAMERQISPLKDLRALLRLVGVMRRERPAVVHSMTPKAGLLCMLAAWLARVPVRVHTFTGLVFPTATGMKRRVLMATDWLTCACATHIIPEGEGVRRDLLGHGITRKPIRVLGHGNCKGIDLDRFKPGLPEVEAEAAKIRQPGVFTFVFIGRIVRDKGINELAEAFARLYSERKDIRLLLVGPYEDGLDPISPQAREIIDRCEAIEAVGQQPDVRPWLAAADALVFPSYREGFPNVVIEAGAMGLPSIVTEINGSREIILEGQNGTIIPPGNSEALFNAMQRMTADEEWRNALAANARQMIATRFDQRFVKKCLLEFYDEIITHDDV